MASLADMLVSTGLQDASKSPDLVGAMQTGAGIAQKQQELNMQAQQFADTHQQVQATKVEKYMDAIEKAQKFSGKAQTQYINNYLPAYSKALGIDDLFPPEAMKFNMSTPEGIGKMQYLVTDTRANPQNAQQNLAAINDPQQFADVPADQRQQYFPLILKAQDEALKDQATVGKQQTELAAKAQDNLQTFRTHIADRGNIELQPSIADKIHINAALDASNRVLGDMNSGKTSSQGDVTLMATNLATTVAKRINPDELRGIMHLPGAQNWTVDKWNQYFAGGVNPNVVQGLYRAIQDQSKQVDQEIISKRALIEGEVNTSRYAGQADSILTPIKNMVNAVPQPAARKNKKAAAPPIPPPTGATISVNGHTLSIQQAQSYMQTNPNGKDAPAVSAALKAAGVQ